MLKAFIVRYIPTIFGRAYTNNAYNLSKFNERSTTGKPWKNSTYQSRADAEADLTSSQEEIMGIKRTVDVSVTHVFDQEDNRREYAKPGAIPAPRTLDEYNRMYYPRTVDAPTTRGIHQEDNSRQYKKTVNVSVTSVSSDEDNRKQYTKYPIGENGDMV